MIKFFSSPPFKMAAFSAKRLPEQLRRSQFWRALPGAPVYNADLLNKRPKVSLKGHNGALIYLA